MLDRMSLRSVIDPNRTLPPVQLEAIGPSSLSVTDGGIDYAIKSEGIKVGDAVLEDDGYGADGDASLWISSIEVNPTGKGYGLAAHVAAMELAIEKGKSFRSDRSLSTGAQRMWQRLVDLGIAEVVEQPTPHSDADLRATGYVNAEYSVSTELFEK